MINIVLKLILGVLLLPISNISLSMQLAEVELAKHNKCPQRTFYFDKEYGHKITEKAKNSLDCLVELFRIKKMDVIVEGHVDEIGTREYNISLSHRIANFYLDYLVSKGIPNNNISSIGFGEDRPVSLEHNSEAYKVNNRIYIWFGHY